MKLKVLALLCLCAALCGSHLHCQESAFGREIKWIGDGPVVRYWPNGNRRVEGEVKDDKPIGPWKFWFESGEISAEGSYVKGGLRDGEWLSYSADGKDRGEEHYKNGVKDGWFRLYWKGVLGFECFYKDGKVEGTTTHWYASGVKCLSISVSEGKRNGAYCYWDENGQLIEKKLYVDGRLEGKATTYWAGGQKKSEGEYCAGKKSGLWRFWDEKGSELPTKKYDE